MKKKITTTTFRDTVFACIFICMLTFKATADPHISLGKGAYNLIGFANEALYYAKSLGLDENVYIRIHFTLRLPEQTKGMIKHHAAGDSIHQFIIYINQRLDRTTQLLTVAHELIHAQQYVNGRLKQVNERIFLWDHQRVSISGIHYLERPWEIEAHQLSHQLKSSYTCYKAALEAHR